MSGLRLAHRLSYMFAAITLCLFAMSVEPINAQVFTQARSIPKVEKPTVHKPRPRPPRTRARVSSPLRAAAAPARPLTFSDPLAYCAAVLTVDAPGETYIGQAAPSWLSQAFAGATSSAVVAHPPVAWRCMDRHVMACLPTGADSCGKPAEVRSASPAMSEYCRNKRRGGIPLEIIGNSPLSWGCKASIPEVTGNRIDFDQRGYLVTMWRDASGFHPSNFVGSVPRVLLGVWQISIKSNGLGQFLKAIVAAPGSSGPPVATVKVTITGGQTATPVGTLEYYSQVGQAEPLLVCRADVILTAGYPDTIDFTERLLQNGTSVDCTHSERVRVHLDGGLVKVEWYRAGATKPSRIGQGRRLD